MIIVEIFVVYCLMFAEYSTNRKIYKFNRRLNRVNLKVTFAAYHDNSGAT